MGNCLFLRLKERANMKLIRNLAIALSVLVLTILAVAAAETTEQSIVFSDISEQSEYAEAVYKLVDFGVINGYDDGTFRPEGGVTRAEMCKMINLTFGLTDSSETAGFPDVTDQWYKPYALAAQKAGYIVGFEDGSFRGDTLITREQVCVILDRILKPYELPTTVTVSDEVSDWAKESVQNIINNYIMPVENGNTFRAKEIIKRYELAVVLSNLAVGPVEPATADVRFFVGTTQYGETEKIVCGEFVDVPANPTPEEGYYFDGWKIVGDDDVLDVKSYMIYENVDFEAVFLKKTFTVGFYDKEIQLSETTLEYGSALSAPSDPTLSGYTFKGWSITDGGAVVNLNDYKVTDNLKFYAVYTKNSSSDDGGGGGTSEVTSYTVRFYSMDKLYDTQTVRKGKNPKLPDDPEAEGYDFAGWTTSADGDAVDVENFVVVSNTNFYAILYEKPIVNPNDPELIEMLQRGYDQLSAIRMTDDKQKTVRTLILGCMKSVLNDGDSGIVITQEYVKLTYNDTIEQVKTIVYDEMTTREASNLSNLITNNVDQDVQDFLKEYFLDDDDLL